LLGKQDVPDPENPVKVMGETTDDGKLYETIWALEPLCPDDSSMGTRSTGPVLVFSERSKLELWNAQRPAFPVLQELVSLLPAARIHAPEHVAMGIPKFLRKSTIFSISAT
jgi:hypothetical protein